MLPQKEQPSANQLFTEDSYIQKIKIMIQSIVPESQSN